MRLCLTYIRKVKRRKAKGIKGINVIDENSHKCKKSFEHKHDFFFRVCHHCFVLSGHVSQQRMFIIFHKLYTRLVESHMHVTSGALSVGI